MGKSEMIQYKVMSIGAGASINDKQIQQKMTKMEEKICFLSQQNDELMINLKSARKEIINLQSQISNESNDYLGKNDGGFMSGVSGDLQQKISKLSADNKRLRAMQSSQQNMQQILDELDTK